MPLFSSLSGARAQRLRWLCATLALAFLSWLIADVSGLAQRRTATGAPSTPNRKTNKTTRHKPAAPLAGTQQQIAADGSLSGQLWTGAEAVSETTAAIMERERRRLPQPLQRRTNEREPTEMERRNLPQNPDALPGAQWPPVGDGETGGRGDREIGNLAPSPGLPVAPSLAPQPITLNFAGASLADTGKFPPDPMGAVGPTQFLMVVNGRVRVFDKNTGAQGPLNTTTDNFFESVRGGAFTSDPRVRYDRLTGRWFVVMINVPALLVNNSILLAVSDGPQITISTRWQFYGFRQNQPPPAGDEGYFADYPTLGIDAQALYIGVNQFNLNESPPFKGTTAFVIRKSSVLDGGPLVVTAFRNLTGTPGGVGPNTPQGVDNFDLAATEGYFIGVDNASYGRLVLRRVSNPGGTPMLSPNILLNVLQTSLPLNVRHQGNTLGTVGYLDALGDRLMMAQLRNGRLWTTHNIGVNNTGAPGAVESERTRTAARWYEIGDLNTTRPRLIQAGTLFAATVDNGFSARNYFMPSLMVSGQGHVALGCSVAAVNEYINAVTAGRWATDPLGTLQPPIVFTNANTPYNPSGGADPNIAAQRWGDYSYTSLDPCDDMTLWTIQQYCDGVNSYGLRIAKLQAPPPATPIGVNPPSIPVGQESVNLTVTGSTANGAGFYNPGPGLGFVCRLSAQIGAGVIVNSVEYLDPATVVLNVSTVNATPGLKNITITNPDGQTVTGNNLLTIGDCAYSAEPAGQSFAATGGNGTLNVTASSGCGWTAASNQPFITVTSGNTGLDNGTVSFSVAPNLNAARTGTLTVAGKTITINQAAGAGCNYAFTPSSKDFLAYGGNGSFTVTTASGCDWQATTSASFISVLSGNGPGNGTVNYLVEPNPNLTTRSGTINAGGQAFTITQEGAPFELAVDDGSFESDGGSSIGGTIYRVNRLTPTSYPATLNAVAIYFRSGRFGAKAGDQLTVLVGNNADGDDNVSGTQFQQLSGRQVNALDEFNLYALPTPLTITQGDFVVGFSMNTAEGVLPTALDKTLPGQRRSYVSDDGVSFRLHDSISSNTPTNYGIRARLQRPGKLLVKGGATLVAESCAPANNAIDPGETVTVNINVQNFGANSTDNLSAALQATGGVATSGITQSYGSIAPGAAVTRAFTFTAAGNCGGTLILTLNFNDAGQDLGAHSYAFPLGAPATTSTTVSYTGAPVAIPDADERGVNIPLNLSGFTGTLADLNVRFDGTQCSAASGAPGVGIAHDEVGDLIIKLTSPNGTTVTLLNRPGGASNSGRNFCQTLLDDDNASAPSIQQISPILTSPVGPPYIGTFRPANPLAAFDGENPNGTWMLNVADVDATRTGTVRAFSLILTGFACCQSQNQPAYESDVAPRPNGNGSATASDWTLVGRFVAGLLAPTIGSEFQRADCAPRDTLGDGRLTVADFTQAGRYAAGLDPLTLAGGPLASNASLLAQQRMQQTFAAPTVTIPPRGNAEITVLLTLAANGNENALGASLRFNAAHWQFVSATPSNITANATFLLNAERSAEGRMGLLLALPANQSLAAGQAELLRLIFKPIQAAAIEALALNFDDAVIAREVVDAQARVLRAGNQLPLGISFTRPALPSRDTRAVSPRFRQTRR